MATTSTIVAVSGVITTTLGFAWWWLKRKGDIDVQLDKGKVKKIHKLEQQLEARYNGMLQKRAALVDAINAFADDDIDILQKSYSSEATTVARYRQLLAEALRSIGREPSSSMVWTATKDFLVS